MPFDSTAVPPPSRQDYLLQLRQRALARMSEDEQSLAPTIAPVSRRQSLRWLGLAAVAAAAGARPLRALAAGSSTMSGTLHERSAMMGSLRVPAPQYGVPSLPQPSVPYERSGDTSKHWGGEVQIALTRAELGSPNFWARDCVNIVNANGATLSAFSSHGDAMARVIYYNGPWTEPRALEVIVSPYTKSAYVAPGGQSFYVEDDGQLWAFLLKKGKLQVRKSLFRARDENATMDDTIHAFAAKMTDSGLLAADREETTINLYRDGSDDPTIGNITARNGKVTVMCYSQEGQFTVDYKAGKLVSSDGN